MKIIVFDVGNAFCSLIKSPNGYGLMIDCGCHNDKDNPVDVIRNNVEWLELKPFVASTGTSYPLGLLHITHPDDDHVRNAARIERELKPYLLRKIKWEEFPDGKDINNDYKQSIDNQYRGSNPETIEWGFDENKIFQIPIDTVKTDEELSKKVRNNSSILRYISHNGVRILFTGDLETAGWQWLIDNNRDFVNTVKSGIDIFIAPHHGHNSGFPKCLFDLIGNVKMIIHSKGSEANIEGTDVAAQYSNYADGANYYNLKDKKVYNGKVLTTRSNGNIYINFLPDSFRVWTAKASSNHDVQYQTNVDVINIV